MTACQVAPPLKPKGCSTLDIFGSTNGTWEGIDMILLELLLCMSSFQFQLLGEALIGVMAILLKCTASSPPSEDGKKHNDEHCLVCSTPATENVLECVWRGSSAC